MTDDTFDPACGFLVAAAISAVMWTIIVALWLSQ